MVLVKYHLPIVWNKYLLAKNIWSYKIIYSLTTSMLFLKLFFMSSKDRLNLNIFTVTQFILYKMEKQRFFSSFVYEVYESCHNFPQKPDIKNRESVSQRCCIGSPWNHREFCRARSFYSLVNWWNSKGKTNGIKWNIQR